MNTNIYKEIIFNILSKGIDDDKRFIIRTTDEWGDTWCYVPVEGALIPNKIELWSIEPYYNGNFDVKLFDLKRFLKIHKVEICYTYWYNRVNTLIDVEETIDDFLYEKARFDNDFWKRIEEDEDSDDDEGVCSSCETKKTLIAISNKLDDVKQLIQDNQYKDILELLMKLYPK